MIKKVILLATALAALVALAAPAAQGAVTLQNEKEENLEVGSYVTAVSNNTTTAAPPSTHLSCELVGITGEVTQNGGGNGDARIGNLEVTTENCISAFQFTAHVTASVGEITLTNSGAGTAHTVDFTSVTTGTPIGTITCTFQASALPLSWTSSKIGITGSENLSGSGHPACPAKATIGGSFDVFVDEGGSHSEQVSIVQD